MLRYYPRILLGLWLSKTTKNLRLAGRRGLDLNLARPEY
jgi:hypothetical protein